jgi:hypothetical protein
MAAAAKTVAFCYNGRVNQRSFVLSVFLLLLSSLFFAQSAENEGIEQFVRQLEKDLGTRNFTSYLQAFSPELRPQQQAGLVRYFDGLKMETVSLFWANKGRVRPEEPEVFIQAVFQNAYGALIETWQLLLGKMEGRWLIVNKKVRGNISQLYKIRMPAERVEQAETVEIRHADIRLTFRNALVFYDNIPELETALLVLGEGRLSFSPSDPNEEHQLDLIYKSRRLEDSIEYAYLRFSDSFFGRNIKISNAAAPRPGLLEAARNKAYSLFMKHYQRYFTIESALSQQPLSFVPQGDEAVIEFRGKKSGDLSYVYSAYAEEEITLYDRTRDRFINLYSPAGEGGKRRMVISFSQRCDVQSYRIDVDFVPQNFYLSAKARVELLSQAPGLDLARFKLNPALDILRIYDEEGRELFFTQDRISRTLYVYFLEPLARGRKFALEIFYRGRLEPPPQITDTVRGGQYRDHVVLLEPCFETYLFSQSAYWYPSPPGDDYFTARLNIITPPQYQVVSNGRLLERGTLNGMQRVTEIDKMGSSFSIFETGTPVKYLSFLVGKLTLGQEQTNPVPLAYYYSSDIPWPKKGLLDSAQEIMEFFENRFGPFPFESLRIVHRIWVTSGGHSPASFVVLNELPRPADGSGLVSLGSGNPASAVDLSQWKEYFLAHEIAHQWWGQGVTWARYRDHWLSEGLAQYSSALFLQSKYGQGAFSDILKKFSRWTEKKAKWGPIIMGSRLSFIDFQAYQAIIYDKTALVLNMLHDLLGEDVFLAGLRQFFRQYKFGAAATGQFIQVMENVSGRELDAFFSPWLESHLLPEIRVSYRTEARTSGYVLKVRVEQKNDVFVFPLWFEWQGRDGSQGREKVIIESSSQDFDLPLPVAPKKVKVNPDDAVPGKFSSNKG